MGVAAHGWVVAGGQVHVDYVERCPGGGIVDLDLDRQLVVKPAAAVQGVIHAAQPGCGLGRIRVASACAHCADQDERGDEARPSVATRHGAYLFHDLNTTVAISQTVAAPVDTLGAGVAPCPTTVSSTNS